MREMHNLTDIVKPVVKGMGYIYWGMEFSTYGKRAKVRVLIDSENGVTLDDCSAVSEQLSSVLDVENPIVQSYTLEVSSPGIERPLFEIDHYRSYMGRKVKVSTYRAIEKERKNFSGTLESVEEDTIILRVDGRLIPIPFHLIRRSYLIYDKSDSAKKIRSK